MTYCFSAWLLISIYIPLLNISTLHSLNVVMSGLLIGLCASVSSSLYAVNAHVQLLYHTGLVSHIVLHPNLMDSKF